MNKLLSHGADRLVALAVKRLPGGLGRRLAVWWRGLNRRLSPQQEGMVLPALEEAGRWGCGWFDSSYELVSGLQVQEDSAEALRALPLATWLELECCAVGPSASAG